MSFYMKICAICPDKRWVEPETREGTPRHASESDGAALDADHTPVPLGLRSEKAQSRMLDRALEIIRERVPEAAFVHLETSDQDSYGFVLMSVTDADGVELLPDWSNSTHPLTSLSDDVTDEIGDLEWNGVVGEDRSGYATIDVRVS